MNISVVNSNENKVIVIRFYNVDVVSNLFVKCILEKICLMCLLFNIWKFNVKEGDYVNDMIG